MKSIKDLYEEAWSTEEPTLRLALLQEGERLCEEQEDLLFMFRLSIASAGFSAGRPEVSLMAFTWCLKAFDQNPNLSRFLRWKMLTFKRVAIGLTLLPQISQEQVTQITDEFKTRLVLGGFSTRAYIQLKSTLCSLYGDQETADELTAIWTTMKPDELCSDPPSERNLIVYRYAYVEKWEEALAAAEPIINGALRNTRVPMCTYPIISKAYWYLGDKAKAAEYTHEGIQSTEGKLTFFGETHELLENLVRMNALTSGLDLLERRITWLKVAPNPFHRYRLYATATLLLRGVVERNSKVRMRVPESFLQEYKLADDRASTALDFFWRETKGLGKAFNHRNDNTYWTDFYGL